MAAESLLWMQHRFQADDGAVCGRLLHMDTPEYVDDALALPPHWPGKFPGLEVLESRLQAPSLQFPVPQTEG